VAALRTALEKLPPDRQQQLKRKLKQEQCWLWANRWSCGWFTIIHRTTPTVT